MVEIRLQSPFDAVVGGIVENRVGNGNHQSWHESAIECTKTLGIINWKEWKRLPCRYSSWKREFFGKCEERISWTCIVPEFQILAQIQYINQLFSLSDRKFRLYSNGSFSRSPGDTFSRHQRGLRGSWSQSHFLQKKSCVE